MRFIILSIAFHAILILTFSNIKKENLTEQKKETVTVEFLNNNLEQKEIFIEKNMIENNKISETSVSKEVFKNIDIAVIDNFVEKEVINTNLEVTNNTVAHETQVITNTETNLLVSESKAVTTEAKASESLSETSNISGNSNNQTTYLDSTTSTKEGTDNGAFEGIETEDFIAKNQDVEGLNYKILASVDPEYPLIAKKVNYKNTVIIKTRFLVNGEGKIEEIKFYDNETKFGFHEEVEKSLKKWKFSPVKLNGKAAKMYFYKSFVFKLN